MADKTIFGCAETGTYQTSAPNPHIDLSGVASGSYSIAQLFADAMSSNETATVSVIKDKDNWAVYSGAKFTNDTVDTLDLSVATLQESKGTMSDADDVTCLGLAPGNKGVSACLIYRNSAYTAVNATETVFPFDTVDYDTGSMWDAANGRIKPNRPGYYIVSACLGTVGTYLRGVYLHKNGARDSTFRYNNVTSTMIQGGCTHVYCNGTTDYLQIAYQVNGANAMEYNKANAYFKVIGPLAA